MQLYWQKLRTLDLWLLAALTNLGVVTPWVFVLYRATGRPGWSAAVPGLWLGFILYAVAALWEAGDRAETPNAPRRRVAVMVIGLVGAYAIAHQAIPAALRTGFLSWNLAVGFLPAAGFLWFMGADSVTEGVSAFVLRPRYPWQLFGAALGAAVLSWRGGFGQPGVRTQLTWGLILVLVAGPLSLYVARTRALLAAQAASGEAPGSGESDHRLGPMIAGLLMLTLLVSFFGSDTAVRVVGAWLSALAGWVGALIWLIVGKYVAALTPFLEWLFAVLIWLFTRGLSRIARKQVENQPIPDVDEWLEQLRRSHTIGAREPTMTAVFLLVIVVTGLLLYFLRRGRRRSEIDADEEFVSLGFWPNLLADLKRLFLGQAPGGMGAVVGADHLDRNDPRRLFRRLQAWGAAQVRQRYLSETPNAYGAALGKARPAGARAAGTVVAVYNQARYGAAPPDGARVAEAAVAVAELEREHSEMPG